MPTYLMIFLNALAVHIYILTIRRKYYNCVLHFCLYSVTIRQLGYKVCVKKSQKGEPLSKIGIMSDGYRGAANGLAVIVSAQ